MNNWEKYREEIESKAQSMRDRTIAPEWRNCVVQSIIDVAKEHKHDVKERIIPAIDWLTQEDESEVDRKEISIPKKSYDCIACKNINTRICRNCENHELFESECESCGGCDGCNKEEETNKAEPQSKARFIECVGKCYINIGQIIEIHKSASELKTRIHTVDGDCHTVDKPINEVIQQLGIEVV